MTGADVKNTSYTLPSGERILRHEAVINAAVVDIWEAFTTAAGLRSFVAPVISLDFRIGGKWESSYNPESKIGDPGNIVNEIICYLPLEMLSIRVVNTPPDFPSPMVAKSIWTVIGFKPVSEGHTLVSTSMVGWKTGPEWDVVWGHFDRGNAYTMEKLYERFETGPVLWENR